VANPRVILIGGMDGDPASAHFVESMVRRESAKKRIDLLAVPRANPQRAELRFPPVGVAYRDNPESQYLWHWIERQGADLILIAGDRDYGIPGARAIALKTRAFDAATRHIPISKAHRDHDRRLARTPREVAESLAKFYGHDFDQPVYIPAMALIARLRLGGREEVERLAAPYLNRDSMAGATPSHLAGHLLFAELGPAYAKLVQAAADRALEMHDEMSDAVFMGCPILAAAGRYQDSLKHLRHMQALCRRPDCLYRHSPLNDAAWGRGNAFPILGMALALSYMPANNPAAVEMRADFQQQLALIAKYQQPDGMWRQVIDLEGVYEESSATAMILTAMARGVRIGWLDRATYEPRIQSAWSALLLRIGWNGEVADTCESTGKQKNADDYLRRAALQGRDARGGGMALLAATELLATSGGTDPANSR
jgi:hypothetical protein